MTEWFSRLADAVPYTPRLPIDRTVLPHANVQPDRNVSSIDGHEVLKWAYGDSTGASQSPAKEHGGRRQRTADADDLLQVCVAALELPGTLLDYHHILRLAYERLFRVWQQTGTQLDIFRMEDWS